jgi:RNA ligase (TIGR02306 family)
MSSNLVIVKRIDEVRPHPNADKLDIAIVGGWQTVVGKGNHKAGDLITYIPVDSVLPDALAEELGVAKYLNKGRVRAAKLRGESSFGLVMKPMGDEGENVADKLQITKYQPPINFNAGEVESPDASFLAYTDIENSRNFPAILSGKEVVAVEKIHGTNCRIGLIRDPNGTFNGGFRKVAGSRELQRKEAPNSIYWHPWTIPAVQSLMVFLTGNPENNQISLFGEVYGKVQKLRYGLNNALGFAAFDIQINGKYLDYDMFKLYCEMNGVPTAPEIARGIFSLEKGAEWANGRSLIPGADHIREGVVVRPLSEQHDPSVGRVILKYVSDAYLCGNFED